MPKNSNRNIANTGINGKEVSRRKVLQGALAGTAAVAASALLPTIKASAATPRIPALPFDIPTRASLANGKDVLGYYHTIPLYTGANTGSSYAGNILPSSNPSTGGRWRQRPYPFIDTTGMTDTDRVNVMLQDLTEAADIGLDGFLVNIATDALGNSTRWQNLVQPMWKAAEQYTANNSPGFKVAPDISMLSVNTYGGSPTTWADTLAPLLTSPAAYKWKDGRPVVALYHVAQEPASWYTSFANRLSSAHGINVAMIPSYQGGSPADMNAYLPLFTSGKFVALHVWGTVSFDTPVSQIQSDFRAWAASNKVPFCGTAGPAWENDRPVLLKETEGHGVGVLQNMWQASITNDDPMVQVVSWNDHEEEHNIRSSTGYQYVPYDMSAYYLTWFKTGQVPVVTRDTLMYAHRMHLSGDSYDHSKQTAGPFVISHGPAADKVFTYAFLTAPANIVVNTTGTSVNHTAVPAGLTTLTDNFAENRTFLFRAVRGGTTVVPSFPSAFPTRSGIVYQDLAYRMGSSARPPIPGVQSDLPQDR